MYVSEILVPYVLGFMTLQCIFIYWKKILVKA